MKRFQICKLAGAPEGTFSPATEAIDGADFDTRDAAMRFVSVFPGKGYGYLWDREEARAVQTFAWERGNNSAASRTSRDSLAMVHCSLRTWTSAMNEPKNCEMVHGITGAGYRDGKPAAYIWNAGSKENPYLLRVCAECREGLMTKWGKTAGSNDFVSADEFEPIEPQPGA